MQLECCLTAYVAHRVKKLATPRKLIEEIDTSCLSELPPKCPTGKFRLHVRIRDSRIQDNISKSNENAVKIGTSPAMKSEGNTFVPLKQLKQNVSDEVQTSSSSLITLPTVLPNLASSISTSSVVPTSSSTVNLRRRADINTRINPGQRLSQIVQTSSGRHLLLTPSIFSTTVLTPSGQRLKVVNKPIHQNQTLGTISQQQLLKVSPIFIQNTTASNSLNAITQPLASALVQKLKHNSYSTNSLYNKDNVSSALMDIDSKNNDSGLYVVIIL